MLGAPPRLILCSSHRPLLLLARTGGMGPRGVRSAWEPPPRRYVARQGLKVCHALGGCGHPRIWTPAIAQSLRAPPSRSTARRTLTARCMLPACLPVCLPACLPAGGRVGGDHRPRHAQGGGGGPPRWTACGWWPLRTRTSQTPRARGASAGGWPGPLTATHGCSTLVRHHPGWGGVRIHETHERRGAYQPGPPLSLCGRARLWGGGGLEGRVGDGGGEWAEDAVRPPPLPAPRLLHFLLPKIHSPRAEPQTPIPPGTHTPARAPQRPRPAAGWWLAVVVGPAPPPPPPPPAAATTAGRGGGRGGAPLRTMRGRAWRAGRRAVPPLPPLSLWTAQARRPTVSASSSGGPGEREKKRGVVPLAPSRPPPHPHPPPRQPSGCKTDGGHG